MSHEFFTDASKIVGKVARKKFTVDGEFFCNELFFQSIFGLNDYFPALQVKLVVIKEAVDYILTPL